MSKKRLGKRIVAFAVAATMTLSTALTGGFGGKTVVNAAEETDIPKRYLEEELTLVLLQKIFCRLSIWKQHMQR